MKKISKALAYIASMAASSGLFITLHDYHVAGKMAEQRQRLQKLYAQRRQEYEYVIKGEHIMAHDKRTARKIYAKRHPKN